MAEPGRIETLEAMIAFTGPETGASGDPGGVVADPGLEGRASLAAFLRIYVGRAGFLDGWAGYYYARLQAGHRVREAARRFAEREHRRQLARALRSWTGRR